MPRKVCVLGVATLRRPARMDGPGPRVLRTFECGRLLYAPQAIGRDRSHRRRRRIPRGAERAQLGDDRRLSKEIARAHVLRGMPHPTQDEVVERTTEALRRTARGPKAVVRPMPADDYLTMRESINRQDDC